MLSSFPLQISRLVPSLLALVFVTSWLGCATPGPSEPPAEVRQALRREFPDDELEIVWVEEAGFKDWGVGEQWSPTAVSRELVQKMELGATRPTKVFLGGVNDERTMRTLRQAHKLMITRLPGLDLIFMGAKSDRAEAYEIVNKMTGRFIFMPREDLLP